MWRPTLVGPDHCALRSAPLTAALCKESWKFRGLHCITREDRSRIHDAQVADDDLSEDVAEVGGDGEVASLVALLGRESWPSAVNLTAAHAPTDDHHGVAVPMVGAAIAVLADCASKLRHRQDHGVGHAVAEIGDEGGN